MSNYNADSMKSLGLLGGVRAKPASIGLENHNHPFLEILGNGLDESGAGYGKEFIIKKYEDGSVSIRDFGRGVPMDKNAKGEYAYEKVFNELWSGGKYNNNEGESNYKFSLGTNGIGGTGTNWTSDFFEVISYRNGKASTVEYEKGVLTKEFKTFKTEEKNGTFIKWKPSKECFRGKGEVDDDFISTTLKDQSIVNGGIKFTFDNKGKVEEYYYENGVHDYILSLSDEESFITDTHQFSLETKGKDIQDDESEENVTYMIKADIAFAFNKKVNFSRFYHNTAWLENGGTPEAFIKNSFTFTIDKFIKDNGLYNKNEKKITFEDVSDSMIVISSTFSTISLFTDQTKKKIESELMKREVTKYLREQLSIFFIENVKVAERIARTVLINKRSREKAESTRLNVKSKLSGSISGISNKIDGFYPAKSKNKKENILIVCEGKSALSSILPARQACHAVLALRGKVLNCLKASDKQITSNEVIMNLMKIIGGGINMGKDKFDIESINFSKIYICTDADGDGTGSILPLLLTAFKKLAPELLDNGHVYMTETPYYELVFDDDREDEYAIDDNELEEFKKKNKGESYDINRIKGLAELSKEAMTICLAPDYQRHIQIRLDLYDESMEVFELFMGKDIESRKKIILESFEYELGEIENE